MALETGDYVSDLVATNPVGATDKKKFGDDHIRLLKKALMNALPQQNWIIASKDDAGSADAYSVTLTTPTTLTAFTKYDQITALIANTNTGASTLVETNIGGTPVAIKKWQHGGKVDLLAGDLEAGMLARFLYDGTHFVLLNPAMNQGIELVEYIDLTNGGANNLSTYDLSHTLEAGYIYVLKGMNVGSTTGVWYPAIRLRNDAGTWLTSTGDYYFSAQVIGNTGVNHQSGASIPPYWYSGFTGLANNWRYDFTIEIRDAMNTGVRTTCIMDSMVHTSVSAARSWGGAQLETADGHDGIRLFVSAGNFNKGNALLYRIKEPS